MNREYKYAAAQSELELYFASRDSILGLRGSGFESGGKVVWDALRIHMAHITPRYAEHRKQLQDLADIEPRVRALPIEDRLAALVTFTPRSWNPKLGAQFSRGARGGNLLGVALFCTDYDLEPPRENGMRVEDTLSHVWQRREAGKREAQCKEIMREGDYETVLDLALAPLPEPTPLRLLDMATAEAEVMDAGYTTRFFAPIKRYAERRLEGALAAYEDLRWTEAA